MKYPPVEKRDLIIMTSKAQRKKWNKEKLPISFYSPPIIIIWSLWISWNLVHYDGKQNFSAIFVFLLGHSKARKPQTRDSQSCCWLLTPSTACDFILIVSYSMLPLKHISRQIALREWARDIEQKTGATCLHLIRINWIFPYRTSRFCYKLRVLTPTQMCAVYMSWSGDFHFLSFSTIKP